MLGTLGVLTLVLVAAGLPALGVGPAAAATAAATAARRGCVRRAPSLRRRWVGRRAGAGGARSPFPPAPALRGTALRDPERRARRRRPTQVPQTTSAAGTLLNLPGDVVAAAAAPSLCIPRLVRGGVSLRGCLPFGHVG